MDTINSIQQRGDAKGSNAPVHLITPDKFHDQCAVFGLFGHREAANLTYLGLYALQHPTFPKRAAPGCLTLWGNSFAGCLIGCS